MATEHQSTRRAFRSARDLLRHNTPVLIALVVVFIIGTRGSDHFLTSSNMTLLAARVAGVGIVAAGMTVLMISAGIDLSIGAAVSVISIVVAQAVTDGSSELEAILIGMGVGLAIGLVLGLIIVFTKAPPFMVTLGALSILGGIGIWQTDAKPVPILSGFDTLGLNKVGGVPIGFIVLMVVFAATYAFLYHTRPGRFAFAIGGNEAAARLAGIRVDALKVAFYCINGALVGLGACVISSRVGSGSIQTGTNLEFEVIAAVVIGGATLAGGSGSLLGTFLGVTLLGAIESALNQMGAGVYLQDLIFGAFIILAVGLRSMSIPAHRSWWRRPQRTRGRPDAASSDGAISAGGAPSDPMPDQFAPLHIQMISDDNRKGAHRDA